jgi:prepilin-type processing-associated H-X9-DG protein
LGGRFKASPSFDLSNQREIHLFTANYIGIHSGLNDGDMWAEARGSTSFDTSRTGTFGINRGASIRDITDGSSHTIVMAEYLTGSPHDQRGWPNTTRAGCQILYVAATPNSNEPDNLLDWPTFCQGGRNSLPQENLPCVPGRTDDNTVCARSRHPGGVHGLKADGSVGFYEDDVALDVWQHLGWISDKL